MSGIKVSRSWKLLGMGSEKLFSPKGVLLREAQGIGRDCYFVSSDSLFLENAEV